MKRKNKILLISVIIVSVVLGGVLLKSCNKQQHHHKPNPPQQEEKNEETEEPKSENVEEEKNEEAESTILMYVSAQRGLNIREYASTDSSIIESVPVNTQLEVYEHFLIDGWRRIKYNNNQYYVFGKYLSMEKVEVIKPQPKPSKSSIDSNPQSQLQKTQNNNNNGKYLGKFKITHYCPCVKCNGNSDRITKMGTPLTVGKTVGCNSIPLGTKISINGHVYTVEDTGNMPSNVIDVLVAGHQEAWDKGTYSADVYIVE